MIKTTNILKARASGRHELEGSDRDGEIESVMVVTTPSSKCMKSRKRKREMEEMSRPSVDAVSEKNYRETAPMILARWKTTAHKSSCNNRNSERNRGLDKSGEGRGLQTTEGRFEKGFDEWTNLGSGFGQRMDLERTSGCWQTSVH